MHDLTTGSVSRHLLKTTSFMLVTMVFQTLYFLIDLYWVGRLGTHTVAAVGVAGNLNYITLALSQMLGVGTTTLVAHAMGRKDRAEAQLSFNQSQVVAMLVGLLFLVVGMAVRHRYAAAMSADAETAALAVSYLDWFIPAMALQFALVAMSAALRGAGSFKPGMVVSTVTIVINMVLAPFLIFGWGTGRRYGVVGAAMSTFVAVLVGVVWLTTYFVGRRAPVHFALSDWRPRLGVWRRLLGIGLPSGYEFALMGVQLFVVYSLTRPFGAAAQAGFGIGMRVVQSGIMPVIALGFSVAPVAGQNFGARLPERVRRTFRDAAVISAVVMLLFTVLCQLAPARLVGVFSDDPEAVRVGEVYLRIVSLTFVCSGLVFVTSSMFQAMGNTVPSLFTSTVRIVISALPAVLLSRHPAFELRWIWWLSVLSVVVQLGLALLLLRREFARRLNFGVETDRPAVGETVTA